MTAYAHDDWVLAPEAAPDHTRARRPAEQRYGSTAQQAPEIVIDLAARRRNLFGLSTALWSSNGEHLVEPGWWKAMSGVPSVNQNVVLCHGRDPELVIRSLDIIDNKQPGLIELAGPALGHAKLLCDAGLICIGSSPFMVLDHLEDHDFHADREVVEVAPADLPAVWDLLCETFGYTPKMAEAAIPRGVFSTSGETVWKLSVDGHVCAAVAVVVVDSVLVVWSMATLPQFQHRDYGRRLLGAVLARAASQGLTESLLLSSPAGQQLYESLGYRVLEHWQQWSRSRWMWAFTPS